jgi:hypothetical protein
MTYSPYGKAIACDTLVMKADGTYTRVFTARGHKASRSSGKWSFDNTAGPQIYFESFVQNIGPSGDIQKSPGITGSFVGLSRYNGQVIISCNDDLDINYRKIQ